MAEFMFQNVAYRATVYRTGQKTNPLYPTMQWPTESEFYRSAQTEQNKYIKVLLPEPKPNKLSM